MGRLKIIEGWAWAMQALGLVWQCTMVVVAICALAGGVDGLPTWGHPLAPYLVVALVSGLLVGVLLLLPYGRDWGRRLSVWARAFGWQAAVGSVLAFSIGLSSPSASERIAAFGVGVSLIFPAVLGAFAFLLAEAHQHNKKLVAEQRADSQVAELVAEVRALRKALEASTTVAPRRRMIDRLLRLLARPVY